MSRYTIHTQPTIEQAMNYAEKYLYNRGFYNRDIGKKIYVTKAGIKKCIRGYGRFANVRIQLIFLIHQLIQKARLIKVEKDKKGRSGILNVFKLQTKVIVNNETYLVNITLRENRQNVLYYYHSGIQIQGKKSPPTA